MTSIEDDQKIYRCKCGWVGTKLGINFYNRGPSSPLGNYRACPKCCAHTRYLEVISPQSAIQDRDRLAEENRALRERIKEALARMNEFTENDRDRSLLREILRPEEEK